MVAVKPSVGRSMTFGPSRLDPSQVSPTSFPCSKCDRKFDSLEDLTAHSKSHIDDEVHSATQRLHSLSNAGGNLSTCYTILLDFIFSYNALGLSGMNSYEQLQ